MSKSLSVKVPDDLDARMRSAAGDNLSEWVVEAIEDRLEREMWAKSKEAEALLGIDVQWLDDERKAVERAQRAAR
ncbi:hypothetical protein [Nocardia macrotermitis]|uniref:CopG family transcriptional regulator n=1 Tax=Nocardia macrotermitis TaxID=2585198 RepID=A0A7K0CZ41_9NOCA|nr:hypothetical protein [Nocardia macrotermitis]MQY18721.1 hypothetical protein [Nocardia macrotermitis]